MTHVCVCHDSCMCVSWLMYVCVVTHVGVCHDSCTCMSWLMHMWVMTWTCFMNRAKLLTEELCITQSAIVWILGVVLVTLQHTATHCNTLQRTATHCHTLQHNNPCCSSSHTQQHRTRNFRVGDPKTPAVVNDLFTISSARGQYHLRSKCNS